MSASPLAPSEPPAPRALDVFPRAEQQGALEPGPAHDDGQACQTCCSGPKTKLVGSEEPEIAAPAGAAADLEAPASSPDNSAIARVATEPPTPAFAAFLQASQRKPPGLRAAAAWSVAAVLHVGALGFALCHAFWHVEELTPTHVKVTLLTWSEARPAAPPPPPAGPTRAERKPTEKPIERPQLTQPTSVQPTPVEDAPPSEATESVAEAGQAGGVEGGVTGGVVGAVLSNVAAAPPALPAAPALTNAERERLVARYLTDVLDRRLKAHLFYPAEAEEEELEGIVWLSVVIDDRGKLVSARVVEGAHLGSLSRAALQTVHRAQPFPPPPAALGTRVEVRVPLTYRLEG